MSGVVVWLTGLPSSGKSTLASRVVERLREKGRPAVLLDADAVRGALKPGLHHTAAERDAFYATLAGLAALLARQDLLVVVAATAHQRAFRERARVLAPRFLEVFLDVPAEECTRRDAKGLYAAARLGQVTELPGVGVAYERPDAPDVIARGGMDEEALARILRLLG